LDAPTTVAEMVLPDLVDVTVTVEPQSDDLERTSG